MQKMSVWKVCYRILPRTVQSVQLLKICPHQHVSAVCLCSSSHQQDYLTIKQARKMLQKLVGAQKIWKPQQIEAAGQQQMSLSQDDLPVRTMKDSYQEAVIPLGSNPDTREKYVNFYDGIRFGRILEDLDTFAVWISYTHTTHDDETSDHKSPIAIVTALVDRIELEEHPIRADKDILMSGHVTWAGSSSLEVTMKLKQEYEGSMRQLLEARFVMVSRNPVTKKSAPVNKLQPVGPEEEKLFQLGKSNKVKRQLEGERTLLKTAPSEEERELIHNLFLQTLDSSASSFRVRVKPDNSEWMEKTLLKNLTICFPEQRNLYNKIFGGFLMRKAFELAWTNAAMYCKTRPYVKAVDDILFMKPVEVGSVLFLSSQVVYTSGSMLQMKVHAEVVNVVDCTRATTNNFYFTFDTRQDQDVPAVLPRSYAESMLYLDGKRHFGS
ncbi:acyl-coenzyme A thioesterase 9, mitochondrial-like [Mizuhopecten yessoensis]|uniref:acyl-coenzyme A thioesterase 9, mitochondrial-like n=1 Tax=Mizuhopecten yessoensis TaxID=6573 RepID=UPI000B45E880|nr:acyl-coenzyme A thioesterase 9, mitochondrial-like [Mizuhopecten yessoensis]